jgi:hypothetical protein
MIYQFRLINKLILLAFFKISIYYIIFYISLIADQTTKKKLVKIISEKVRNKLSVEDELVRKLKSAQLKIRFEIQLHIIFPFAIC